MPRFRNLEQNFISRRRFLKMLGAGTACATIENTAPLAPAAKIPAQSEPALDFEEIPPSASGISWVHTAGLSSSMYLPETDGAGCAFVDYDNDGWMDIYLVNSGKCDFYTPPHTLRNMLYHNNGDGTFTDVTEKAGVATPGWSTSAVWFDYDNDGRLDLFVLQFAKLDKSIWCGNKLTGERWYCRPTVYEPMPNWLFHNNGDGTFTDLSRESGITRWPGKGWGVVAADINNDGWVDLFIGNDTVPNFLFANRGKGKFEEIGALAAVGYNPFGLARSGMGVDACDYDQDGWIDLFVANIDHEMFSLYHNNRDETFTDVAPAFGIASGTLLLSGMGQKFFDYDNDGNSDLLLCNGHPELNVDKMVPGVTYAEPMMLYRNAGRGFEDVSKQSGSIFSKRIAGRGLAIGDFDNNGSVDALVSVSNDAPIMLRNNAGRRNHWLGIHLVGRKCNRDAVGAKITYRAGDLERHQFKVGGGSYLSYHDPRIVLGLGPRTKIDWLEVRWPQPSGSLERLKNLPIDRYIKIVE